MVWLINMVKVFLLICCRCLLSFISFPTVQGLLYFLFQIKLSSNNFVSRVHSLSKLDFRSNKITIFLSRIFTQTMTELLTTNIPKKRTAELIQFNILPAFLLRQTTQLIGLKRPTVDRIHRLASTRFIRRRASETTTTMLTPRKKTGPTLSKKRPSISNKIFLSDIRDSDSFLNF